MVESRSVEDPAIEIHIQCPTRMWHDVAGTRSQHDTTGLPTWRYCPVTMRDPAPEMSNRVIDGHITGFSEENGGVLLVNQLCKYQIHCNPLFLQEQENFGNFATATYCS